MDDADLNADIEADAEEEAMDLFITLQEDVGAELLRFLCDGQAPETIAQLNAMFGATDEAAE